MEPNKYSLRDPSLFNSQGLIGGTWKFAAYGKTFPVIEPQREMSFVNVQT